MAKPGNSQPFERGNSNQRLPNNWERDGLSKGKEGGAVRPTPDAHNERTSRPPKHGC